MAIKGKGKARSRRVIAAPPRPQLVVRKPPLWRRTWVVATVAVLVVGGTLTGVYLGVHSAHVRGFKTLQKDAITTFSNHVGRAFPQDASIIFPDLPSLFPDLTTDLSSLQSGKLAKSDALTLGDRVATQAEASAAALGKIDVNHIIPASAVETGRAIKGTGGMRQAAQSARFLMVHGMQLYAQIGNLVKTASDLTAAQQNAIALEAQGILADASSVFNQGFKTLEDIRKALGFTQFTLPPRRSAQPPAPQPSPQPSPTPSASASASTEPSSSPSASGSP